MPLGQRLLRNLKANGPKTALLAVLSVVLLYVCLPPLWQMVAGASSEEVTEDVVAAIAPAAAASAAVPDSAAAVVLGWEALERLRREDELFQTADAHAVRRDVFTLRTASLPLETLLAESIPPPELELQTVMPTVAPQPSPAPPANPADVLTLQSTVVGTRYRAALIDGTVYVEGATLAVGGQTWTLTAVDARRVVLEADGRQAELTIDPFQTGTATLRQ